MKLFSLALSLTVLTVACNTNPKASETTTAIPQQQISDTVNVVQEHPQTSEQPTQIGTEKPEQNSTHKTTEHTKAEEKTSDKTTAATSQSGTATSTSANEAKKKKGWSKTAKGAVIGGVTDAAAGAIIDKNNRGAGAVIGGAVGAGAGAIIGNEMDKKDGRH